MKAPFEQFLEDTLKEFEQHLRRQGLKDGPIDHRMRGAREYVRLLVEQPHKKHERTKGTV